MQANAMADLYYNPKYGMDDNDRSKIQFVLINDDGAASDFDRLKQSGQYQGKFLPALNDDDNSSLMNAISGGKQWPKDDMAILDKEGRMIQYFDSSQSGMSNRANNKIKTAVEKILSDDYKNPCVADESKEESKDESKDESVDESKDSKEEMSPMDELRASCLLNCTGCKGKMKKGKCQLKKKLKCKFMLTKELCTQAKCKYKAPRGNKKAKCKGKGIF